jgi:threonine synthase
MSCQNFYFNDARDGLNWRTRLVFRSFMKYKSTRGQVADLGFSDALLMGLASDGGLLVPENIPDVRPELEHWRDLNFVELAQELIPKFIDDIDSQTLRGLISESYASFSHADVVALQDLDGISVLELFHGPTLAFKDVALQLLGKLFEHVLGERGQRLNILGATSGDTGSAAIDGVRGQKNIDIFIMYPKGRVSPLQELQMTTVADDNVHCIELDGSFDDCQNIMKTVFADAHYKATYQLGAVNSVNWARVLAQIVYYGYASLRSSADATFCVPTGNFGNVFAAYLAQRMGFPIAHLLVATNDNDILARFFATGVYARGEVHQTLSPAMDIQVASNFERFLYYHFDQDSDRLVAFMQEFTATGSASIGAPPNTQLMSSVAVNTEQTLAAMRDVNQQFQYVLDPHTAVGYHAARKHLDEMSKGTDIVVVATAHPAKFPDAVQEATGFEPTHPTLEALKGLDMHRTALPCDIGAVKTYLVEKLQMAREA